MDYKALKRGIFSILISTAIVVSNVSQPVCVFANVEEANITDSSIYDRNEMNVILQDGKKIKIDDIDVNRGSDRLIIYTNNWESETSNQNEWGVEIVVNSDGIVTKRTDPGTKVDDNIIPEKGFVLSAHGIARELLKDVKLGDFIETEGVWVKEIRDTIQNQKLAQGVTHEEVRIENYDQIIGNEQRVNIIKADTRDSNVEIITSKALDSVVAKETILSQANREEYRGRNVVAGVTGDMFNADTGINMTMQIKDSELLINHAYESHTKQFPVFGIKKDGSPFIDTLAIRGKLNLGYNEITIDSLNRNEKLDNKIGLFTYDLNQEHKFKIESKYIENGSIAVINLLEKDSSIKAGNTYEGKVDAIYDNAGVISIPENSVIIGGFGDKKSIIEDITEGQTVEFKFDVYKGDNQEVCNDIVNATGGYNTIVKNKKALTSEEMKENGASETLVDAKNARTGIGITENGEVVAITIDKESVNFNESKGVTLPQLAKLLEDEGVVSGISLDGGGSTEMIVQPQGKLDLVTINNPSDGSSRPLTNAIMFLSKAEKTVEVGDIKIDKPITIFKGASYIFDARVSDANGNPYELGNEYIEWDTNMGTIDSNGKFVANEVGVGEVSASIGNIRRSITVNVVDEIDNFEFTEEGPIGINPGNSKSFEVKAIKDNKNVVLNPNSIEWIIDENIGRFDENGILTINKDVEKGTQSILVAKVGNLEKYVDIIVGMQDLSIDDFESQSISNYTTNKAYVSSYDIELSNEQCKSGQYSLKLTYDYTGWSNGNGAMYVIPKTKPKAVVKPKALGMWVYGDKKAPWLRGQIITSDGSKKTIDFTKKVDWEAWKYVEIPIESSWTAPVELNYIYAVETDKTLMGTEYGGAIYIDDIQWVYTEDKDLLGPEFSKIYPYKDNVYKENIEFSTIISDDKSGVNSETIEMKVNGDIVNHNYDHTTNMISYRLGNLKEGEYRVEVTAKDFEGNLSVPGIDKTYTIDLSEDNEGPVISEVTPTGNAIEKSDMPRIAFKIEDDKSEVLEKDVKVTLDGKNIPVDFDEDKGYGYSVPDKKIKDGKHKLEIEAKDSKGNCMEAYTSEFTINKIKQPQDKNNFNITLIPDTQGFTYSKLLFEEASKKDSDLVIHLGDLVDQETKDEWSIVDEELKILKDKEVLATPGNHEAFKGNLNEYDKRFGNATYHLEYGNLLIVGLNSSKGQSISESDPTQFEYLREVLDKNKCDNIVIATHVPIKDTNGTKHEMEKDDADKLKDILEKYKEKNPKKNIQVISGHTHWLEAWNENGIEYAIVGNGASKSYISPQQGAIHGIGNLSVNKNNIEFGFDPYLTDVRIKDFAIRDNILNVAKGSTKQLNPYGDFREVNMNYIVNLYQQDNINMRWESSDESIVKVDGNGEIITLKTGTANITLFVGNKEHTITVNVVDPNSIKISALDIRIENNSIRKGDKINIIATGTDANGTLFAIDLSKIKFKIADEEMLKFDKKGRLIAIKSGFSIIEYEYNGFYGEVGILVK
ncbi:phosphodiester glycosidase family protein [Clostridium sp.]|uniref:phosphodiester glycosidase family protein n=1 Tax=Clostridium sp. TaxID=1506 RepID=UPI003F2A2454